MSTGLAARSGMQLFVPPLYDVLWGVIALLVPFGALAVLYLVVRAAVRRGGSGPTAQGDVGTGPTASAAWRRSTVETARRHGAVVAGLAWVLAALLPQGVLLLLGPVLLLAPGLLDAPSGSAPPYGAVLVGLVPASVGLTYLAVHAIGERTWPRPRGPVRRANLAPRSAARVAPRRLLLLTTVWSVALVLVLAVCAAVAQEGQRLVVTMGASTRSASPFPGAFYGVPLLLGTALVLLGTALVLRQVAHRPVVLDDDPAYDDASRGLSAHRVLRGIQLLVGWTLAGVLVVASSAVRDVGLGGAASALAALGAVVGLVAAVVAAVPARPPVPSTPAAGLPSTPPRLRTASFREPT